jgi:hypothetical protein
MPVIEHIVLLKVKDHVSKESVTRMLEAVVGLRAQIEGVLSIRTGTHSERIYKDYADRSDGFTHVLVVRFASVAALEQYAIHPEHVAVKQKFITPIVEKLLVLDYPVDEEQKQPERVPVKSALPLWMQNKFVKAGAMTGVVLSVAFALLSLLDDQEVDRTPAPLAMTKS